MFEIPKFRSCGLPVKRLVVYLLLVCAFFASLYAINSIWEFPWFNNFKSVIHRLLDALLLALPVWGLRRKRFLFSYIALAAIYLLANVWYYRNYGCIMPLTSFLLVNNLPTIGPGVIASLRWIDLLVVLPLAVYAALYAWLDRLHITRGGEKLSRSRRLWFAAGILLLIAGITAPPYLLNPRASFDYPCNRYKSEQIRGLREYGWINYWIFQFASLQSCSPEEKSLAASYVERAKSDYPQDAVVADHRRNLILILVESLCDWPINLKVQDREITPYLNRLTRDTSVLYFSRVLPQVKDGRSSDAQLMLNTGLLPLATGAASGLYGSRNTYPSLPKALKGRGYTSISLTCDFKTVWNQDATSKSYGFDRLYERMSAGYKPYESDRYLFERGLPILRGLKQPFYAQFVTFSGHDPVKTDFRSFLNEVRFADESVKNYLIITEYVDRCIEGFLDSLKREGLFERSIIVITGDHASTVTRNRFDGRSECTPEDGFIPFFVLNAPLRTQTGGVIGQIDLYPSLLDLMGVHDYPFRGLGESVFRHRSNYAVDASNNHAGCNADDSIRQRRRKIWRISDILLRMDYFKDDPSISAI